ncbi:MAG: autotransporter outer membrane beta-barrel domain-containing protein, partial [Lysobacter sp.]|nr:autotransporter outer membrane beta-barrel domain-containing protein [Lysobacter sp.]
MPAPKTKTRSARCGRPRTAAAPNSTATAWTASTTPSAASPSAWKVRPANISVSAATSAWPIRRWKPTAATFNVGIHWLYAPGGFWTQGAAGYSYASFDAEREIAVGTFNRRSDAHFSNDGVYAMLEAGWRWDGASVRVEPLLGVYYNKVESATFTEQGAGDANLIVSTGSFDTTTAGVGVRFSGVPGSAARKWTPTADIRYLHDLQDDQPFARNAFAGATVPGFGVSGFAAERNRWNVGLGLAYRMSPVSSGFIEYRGEIGSDDRAHSLNLGLRLGWGGTSAVAAARA